MRHTPGPWSISSSGALKIIALSDLGTFIEVGQCAESRFIDGVGIHTIEKSEAIANARLMASAPEMLEALEGIQAEIERDPNTLPDCYKSLVRNAIAKAKGK